jgi:hypothetical protein
MSEDFIPGDPGPAGESDTRAALDLAPKMEAAGVAGAVSLVLVWLGAQLGVEIPVEVAAAIPVIVAWAAGYLKKG